MSANPWLMLLSFILGAVLTYLYMVRSTTRAVPHVSPRAAATTGAAAAGAAGAAGLGAATAARADTSKVEAPKVEAPKAEAPKVEAPKAEAPKVEAPKAEAPKVEAPKVEAPKVEAPKAEAPKAAAPVAFKEGKFGADSAVPAADGSGPSGWTVKGNEDSMLYHTPESRWYSETKPEVWFKNEPAAERAGFTRWDQKSKTSHTDEAKSGDTDSKAHASSAASDGSAGSRSSDSGSADSASAGAPVAFARNSTFKQGKYGPDSAVPAADGSGPSGWTIKGNEDSMLYHTPDSPWYGRTIAEVWFREESTAEAAGFTRWDKRDGSDRDSASASASSSSAQSSSAASPSSASSSSADSAPVAGSASRAADSSSGSTDAPSASSAPASSAAPSASSDGARSSAKSDSDSGVGGGAAPLAASGSFKQGKYGPGSAEPGPGGSGPSGWTIKGNEDSMLYHTPDSPWYGRTIAEVWFREEPAAQAAGFQRWDRNRKK